MAPDGSDKITLSSLAQLAKDNVLAVEPLELMIPMLKPSFLHPSLDDAAEEISMAQQLNTFDDLKRCTLAWLSARFPFTTVVELCQNIRSFVFCKTKFCKKKVITGYRHQPLSPAQCPVASSSQHSSL